MLNCTIPICCTIVQSSSKASSIGIREKLVHIDIFRQVLLEFILGSVRNIDALIGSVAAVTNSIGKRVNRLKLVLSKWHTRH